MHEESSQSPEAPSAVDDTIEDDAVDGDSLPVWPTLEHGARQDHGIFALREVKRRSPRTGRAGWYKVLEVPTWSNIVALTPEREVVLIEQYRHGTDELTLEIPGGMVEAGEDAAAAAARELREETGYTGGAPELLGVVHPNPAFQDNVCYTYLVPDARATDPQQPDEGEHIRVVTRPLAEIPSLIRSGAITHSLVICGFTWFFLSDEARFGSSARPGVDTRRLV